MKRLTGKRHCEIAFYEPVYCKFSNKNYIHNVLKRDIESPVCEDDYYNGGVVSEEELKEMYIKLGEIEDIMDEYKVKDLKELELMISAYIDERGEW